MRWLKAAVIIMGVMIVAMLVTIVVTIFRRMTAARPADAPATVAAPVVPGPVPAGPPPSADVTLPAGAQLKDITGPEGRLVLHLVAADGQESLMLLDPATGKVTLTIALHPGH
jgi:CDP-diacylglycerol pyrophosphatase